VSYILRANETEKELTPSEITANCAFLISAGAESSASMLSGEDEINFNYKDLLLNDLGCLFYLLKNPDCLQKLTELIRGTYTRESDMNSKALARLPYLHAILEESLRMYMPVPGSLPHMTPEGGAIGKFSNQKFSTTANKKFKLVVVMFHPASALLSINSRRTVRKIISRTHGNLFLSAGSVTRALPMIRSIPSNRSRLALEAVLERSKKFNKYLYQMHT
jgi:hypothetical protein